MCVACVYVGGMQVGAKGGERVCVTRAQTEHKISAFKSTRVYLCVALGIDAVFGSAHVGAIS